MQLRTGGKGAHRETSANSFQRRPAGENPPVPVQLVELEKGISGGDARFENGMLVLLGPLCPPSDWMILESLENGP